jgi:predicted phosphodiesterase
MVDLNERLLDRFGIIGDVHAEDDRLERALRVLAERAEVLLCVGDIADGYGDLNRACDLLRRHNVQTVTGNHDRWLVTDSVRKLANAHFLTELSDANRQWILALPATRRFTTSSGLAVLCHGIGKNDMAKVDPHDQGYAIDSNEALQQAIADGEIDFLFNGHSHRFMVRKFGHLTIINAGTLKRDHDPCFLFVDMKARVATRFDFDENGTICGESNYEF